MAADKNKNGFIELNEFVPIMTAPDLNDIYYRDMKLIRAELEFKFDRLMSMGNEEFKKLNLKNYENFRTRRHKPSLRRRKS